MIWIVLLSVICLCLGYRPLPKRRDSGVTPRSGLSASRHPDPQVISSEDLTLEFSRVIDVSHPSYVQILRDGILSVTSFSLMRKGFITEYDISDIEEKKLRAKELLGNYLWPNELSRYIDHQGNPVLIVPDGFLTPGQNDGGLFTITNPEMPRTKPKRITAPKPGWFYHKAMYLELPISQTGESGDVSVKSGRVARGVLTARANKPVLGRGLGELVWLSMPNEGEDDGSPWEETVLAKGPDVMFEVTDLDSDDGLVDIISAHFFGDKISIASIRATDTAPYVAVERTMTIDTKGKPYGLCLANLRSGEGEEKDTHLLVSTHECAYDMAGALNTMVMGNIEGRYPSLLSGEKVGAEAYRNPYEMGGSLYAYEIPSSSSSSSTSAHVKEGNDDDSHGDGDIDVYNVKAWRRSTLFQGFKVKSWGNVNPGAPGFPYVFYLKENEEEKKDGDEASDSSNSSNKKPLILLAGDGTRSAYIFSPCTESPDSDEPQYKLAFEVECGATVGSAAVSAVPDGTGDVEIVVPSYELNKVHMYRLSKARAGGRRSASAGVGAKVESQNHRKRESAVGADKRRSEPALDDRKDVLLFSTDPGTPPATGGPLGQGGQAVFNK